MMTVCIVIMNFQLLLKSNMPLAVAAHKFNHHYDPEVAISYDEQGNCVAYTTRDVSAGSELRISYGYITNPSALFGELSRCE